MVVWWGTPLEARSAFARLVREGRLDLTIEMAVLNPRWDELFDRPHREAAHWRLVQAMRQQGARALLASRAAQGPLRGQSQPRPVLVSYPSRILGPEGDADEFRERPARLPWMRAVSILMCACWQDCSRATSLHTAWRWRRRSGRYPLSGVRPPVL